MINQVWLGRLSPAKNPDKMEMETFDDLKEVGDFLKQKGIPLVPSKVHSFANFEVKDPKGRWVKLQFRKQNVVISD